MALVLTDKQNEYIRNADARWNFKVGAVRSGKSFVDVSYIIPSRLRAVHGESGLSVILGVSRDTIERNVLAPMREIYTSALIGTINGKNMANICGEWVYCLGAEKVSQVAKIQGSSIKYCYGDEIAKWNEEVFRMLESRLDKTYSKFDGACNPENPNHWLKDFIEKEGLDAYIQEYVIDDNPFLPKAYVENLKHEYAGTVYYDRYILGKWALAEGLIYPMYQDALIPELPDGRIMENVISLDYGTMNAFAGILWSRIGDVWYAHHNYYYSGRETGVQKTDGEYLADLEKEFDDVIQSLQQGQKIEVIIDPSASSFIALLKKTSWAKVHTANNNVADGLRETASAMRSGAIKIVDNASMKPWKQEVAGYIWDDSAIDDVPIKIDDHDMDAMRYFVKTKRVVKPRRMLC